MGVESLQVFTALHRSSVVSRLWMAVVALAIYCEIVVFVTKRFLPESMQIQSNLHTLLGLVLGLFLAFRTNTSYDRWWEGRKLWGQLVNDVRNLSLKVSEFAVIDADSKKRFGKLLVAFAYALKEHLRSGEPEKHIPENLRNDFHNGHVPGFLARQVYERMLHWKREHLIDGFEMLLIDSHGRSLMDVCGACERIQKTPIARSNLVFIRQGIAMYLLTLPFGLVKDLGVWTGAATAIVGYFMIGVELIAEDIEDPFGHDMDDLKLDDICRTIRHSVEGTLGA